jgi:uncharacterized phage-associated protein
VPAWSPEIANEFVQRGRKDRRAFCQGQLQKLVYVAHGWCLAYSDQPLTGDRPEAWSFGPVYRRLSDALAECGLEPVVNEIHSHRHPNADVRRVRDSDDAALSQFEMDVIEMVYQDFGRLSSPQLSFFTQGPGSPWATVFANGEGEFRDIHHQLIRVQFVQFAEEAEVAEKRS